MYYEERIDIELTRRMVLYSMKTVRSIIKDERGQSVVEYALIVALISVILLSFLLNEAFTCTFKRTYIKTSYEIYLAEINESHTNQLFNQFMIEHGFDNSHYDYNNGQINCEHHPYRKPREDPEPGTIPWL